MLCVLYFKKNHWDNFISFQRTKNQRTTTQLPPSPKHTHTRKKLPKTKQNKNIVKSYKLSNESLELAVFNFMLPYVAIPRN